MRNISKSLFALGALFFCVLNSAAGNASAVQPSDVPYYRLDRDATRYIYDDETRDIVGQLAAYHQVFRRMYDDSYGWRLDEPQDLILASFRQQIGNAYATIMPNVKSLWFPSGGSFLEESAVSSWVLTLDAHETAHLYQLNAKGGFNSLIKPVFGNSVVTSFFIIPIFVHPNVFTPTFLVEGNAVLQESRINQGGRLHSGEVRALVLAQIKDRQIDPSRLINDEFRFPFGRNAYNQGGYFQAHLAAKHGIKKTNSFFAAQGERYFWPLLLNKTFRQHFGASYPQEIREYVRGMEGLADKQQFTRKAPILRSTFLGPLNHDSDRVWFLATDGVEPPILHVFNKTSRQMTESQRELSLGKVFFDGETPLAVDTDQNDLHHVTYSLYGEGRRMDPRYKGQIVSDQRAGKTVALGATQGWLETRLLVNGEPYDIAHSNPILSDAGDIYYFRQNGSDRMLYKNREPVFKFSGFYGKLTEVTPDGTIYFIGSTDYGSTLYRYQKNEISRVLESDRVVDARKISDKEFLVEEIEADGHTIHIVGAAVKAGAPAVYSYGFTTETVVPDPPLSTNEVQSLERPYNSLRTLRFSGLDLLAGYSTVTGAVGGVQGYFADPLEYNLLTLDYFGTEFRDKWTRLGYAFTKYLVDYQVRYRYWERWWDRTDGGDQRAYNQDVDLGISVPLLRYRKWDAVASFFLTYDHEDMRNDPTSTSATVQAYPDTEDSYGTKSRFSLQYSVPTGLALYPWREFSFNFVNRLDTRANEWRKKNNTSAVGVSYQHGFPKEFHAAFFGQTAWAETKDIDVGYAQFAAVDDIYIPLLTGRHTYTVKNASSARIEVRKVFNIRSYSPRIPFGLDRLAPVVVAQGVFFDSDRGGKYPPNNFEWGYGVDLQVRLLHRIPGVVRYLVAYDTRYPVKAENQLQFSLKKDF